MYTEESKSRELRDTEEDTKECGLINLDGNAYFHKFNRRL